ncbi:MAG: Rrf2 family transcriptional regulator [Chitinivibrionales bacterium]|nr:Rrf2 family transcriptional regulator [Chitinivibrionales bacterium]MBD3396115.1 Rrf2 family transcriptional regulator [Chitinivibrionales bacterium]
MIFKTTTRYAVCAALYIAQHGKQRVITAGEIAAKRGIPYSYLPRILSRLAKCGIIKSFHGGREKGYRMVRDANEISVFDVFDMFEGWSREGCLLRPANEDCMCPAHHHWKRIQEEMFAPLKRYKLGTCLGVPAR